jgi:pimeloyl-ACP methyl ester carboxylesterase
MWAGHLPRYADYHSLAPDLPGHGRSLQLRSKSLIETADRVAELIDTRAAEGQAHLVGLPLGGEVAYLLIATDQAGR